MAQNGEFGNVIPAAAPASQTRDVAGERIPAPLAGNVFKVLVDPGDVVSEGQPILIVEAMKMETEVSAPRAGTITGVHVAVGDAVAVGDPLVSLT